MRQACCAGSAVQAGPVAAASAEVAAAEWTPQHRQILCFQIDVACAIEIGSVPGRLSFGLTLFVREVEKLNNQQQRYFLRYF